MADYVERVGGEKVAELLSLENVVEGWEDLGVKNDVHSYRKQTGTGLYYIKGVGDMNYPAESIYTKVDEYATKKQWDEMFIEGRTVQRFNDHASVSYELFSAPWPVTNRDFLFGSYVQKTPELIVSAGFSVEHPSVPPVKNAVRAQMDIGGFIYRALSPAQTRVTYILYMDPRGSIPQMVVNSSQKKQTQNISRIRTFLARSS